MYQSNLLRVLACFSLPSKKLLDPPSTTISLPLTLIQLLQQGKTDSGAIVEKSGNWREGQGRCVAISPGRERSWEVTAQRQWPTGPVPSLDLRTLSNSSVIMAFTCKNKAMICSPLETCLLEGEAWDLCLQKRLCFICWKQWLNKWIIKWINEHTVYLALSYKLTLNPLSLMTNAKVRFCYPHLTGEKERGAKKLGNVPSIWAAKLNADWPYLQQSQSPPLSQQKPEYWLPDGARMKENVPPGG